MNANPIEECPPDEQVTKLDINATLDGDVWTVNCPQWKFALQTRNITRTVATLLAEIENHNDGDGGFCWEKFAKREGIVLLRPERRPLAPSKMFGRKTWKPIYPDNDLRQRNHSNTTFWQR